MQELKNGYVTLLPKLFKSMRQFLKQIIKIWKGERKGVLIAWLVYITWHVLSGDKRFKI